MRMLPLLSLLLATGCRLAAADDVDSGITIDHWGNALLVTAPDDRQDPTVTRQLAAEVTMQTVDTPLTDVVDFLHKVTGVNMVIDPALRLDDPHLSLTVANMSLEHVLHWVSVNAKCNWSAVDGAVYFSNKPIQGAQRTVLYDVSDLIQTVQDFPGPELGYNAGANGGKLLFSQPPPQQQQPPSLDDLTDFLKKVLDTQSSK